jgi:hypothetical protein
VAEERTLVILISHQRIDRDIARQDCGAPAMKHVVRDGLRRCSSDART